MFHAQLCSRSGREIICIDGKAERGTVLANGRNPDIVSAYSFNTGITLATEACPEKSNEIKAIPQLIDKLDFAGKTVTADAMSMQKDIIDRIRGKGADFLIELKANQPSLRYGVETDSKSISRYILILMVPNSVMEESRQEHTTYMMVSKLLPTRRNGAET